MMRKSSSIVHEPFLTSGFLLLFQCSLHCFPFLPGIVSEHNVHLVAPWVLTQCSNFSSSSNVHEPLTNPGLRILVHLCKH